MTIKEETMPIDVAYCLECGKFSFVKRTELSDRKAECQHYDCSSSKLTDVGDMQRELMYLAEHSKLVELKKLIDKAENMFEINKTPAEERRTGRAFLLTYWELEDMTKEEVKALKGRRTGGIVR